MKAFNKLVSQASGKIHTLCKEQNCRYVYIYLFPLIAKKSNLFLYCRKKEIKNIVLLYYCFLFP